MQLEVFIFSDTASASFCFCMSSIFVFIVQLSHPYMTIGKTIALTRQTFVGIVMSLLFNMLSRLVIAFLPRSKHRIDAFELWCWRRLLRVPWTARRSNQFIQKEISPEYSLEGLMLKLKLQSIGHLMRRADSFGKTLMLGKIECRMASPTQWTWVWVDSSSWWWTGRPGVLQFIGSQRVWHDWVTELNWTAVSNLFGSRDWFHGRNFSIDSGGSGLFKLNTFTGYFISILIISAPPLIIRH